MLRNIDPGLVTKLQLSPNQLPSYGFRFFAPNMNSITLPFSNARFPNAPPGHVIRRIDFDRLLIDEARNNPLIEVIQGVTIANVETDIDGVTLVDLTGKLRYSARICVIAAGAASKLTRSLVPENTNTKHHATGIRRYYAGVKGIYQGNFVDFYFLKDFLPGYLWVFPLPDGRVNVGAGIPTDRLKKKKLKLKMMVEQALLHNPHLAERFREAHPVSGFGAWDLPIGSKKMKLSGNRFLLAGDSASLVDPFTGEGIGNAMWSGFAASEHIEQALAADRFDAAFNKKYDRFIYRKLWKELRLSTWIQRLIQFPALFNWVMNKIAANPKLQQSFIRMIDDPVERKKLARLWFYFKLLFEKKVKQ
jgi:flavin-dependent dehydrogenase